MSPEQLILWSMALPLLGVVGILACSRFPNVREAITLLSGIGLLALVLTIYGRFTAGQSFSVAWLEWIPGLSIAFHVDALGLLFALVASCLWPVTSLYAIGYMRAHKELHQTRFFALFAVAMMAVMGVAFASNLLTLFIFYEVLTLSTYPLVTHAGTESAKRGGRIYLGILLSTSVVFFLLAILGTWVTAGRLDFVAGGVFGTETPLLVSSALFVLFAFGIGKAALMPFHRWLPAAMVAPTPVSALLHAVAVVKAGVFSLLKVSVFIFGLDLLAVMPTAQGLLYLASASVLLASLVAMRQDNLKARLAYSTVSQLGYISIGAFLATESGVVGGAMHIAAHAVGKITLFFCAGAILVAAHKTDISDMRGLGRQMPLTMLAFFIGSLSIIGVPPTGGTWSKWFLFLGTLEAHQWWIMITLMISSLLNIAYLLPISVRAFFPGDGTFAYDRAAIQEAPLASLVALSLTAFGCLLLFVFPQPVYELANQILSDADLASTTLLESTVRPLLGVQ